MANNNNGGRRRIRMEKMEKESNLMVTFSKRRTGLFKKASELSTLCGVQIAIIVFSPTKKVFSFGHPNVETIVDSFLSQNPLRLPKTTSGPQNLVENVRNASIADFNANLNLLMKQLDVEKAKGEVLDEMRKTSETKRWWENPIDEMNMEELKQMKIALETLKGYVYEEADKLVHKASTSSSPPNPNDMD